MRFCGGENACRMRRVLKNLHIFFARRKCCPIKYPDICIAFFCSLWPLYDLMKLWRLDWSRNSDKVLFALLAIMDLQLIWTEIRFSKQTKISHPLSPINVANWQVLVRVERIITTFVWKMIMHFFTMSIIYMDRVLKKEIFIIMLEIASCGWKW